MDTRNPILDYGPAYEDLGPIHRSTSSAKPMPRSQPNAAVRKMIGELGLRYRPSAQADLEAHAASIALLASDVADLPPHLLERAVAQWVRTSKFMPKAAELIDLARSFLPKPRTPTRNDLEAEADRRNKRMASDAEGRRGAHWTVDEGELRLTFDQSAAPRNMRPITTTQAEIVAYAKKQQESKRRPAV